MILVELSTEFFLQILVYTVSFGSMAGVILTKLKYIEQKQDKYNNIIERTFKLENNMEGMIQKLDEHIQSEGDKAH
jgi:hypothetical protein